MEKIKWNGYEWLTQERWGSYHEDKATVWYDPSAVSIDDGMLLLKCRPNPKTFVQNGEEINIPIGIGLISCTTKFGYGKFEIEAKMPSGILTWPAFWMWSFDSWPPEIDVFEGYSNKRGSYFNWSWQSLIGRFWAVNSNVHLGKAPKNYMLGGKSHWLGWRRPDRKFNKYGCVWTEDEITILFNDRIVRRITDEKTVSQLRGTTMNVIINNSTQDADYEKNTHTPLTDMPEHVMEVRYFKYTPI